jgi:hypothetical protein
MMQNALLVKILSNITFPFEQTYWNFVALSNNGDLHTEDCLYFGYHTGNAKFCHL